MTLPRIKAIEYLRRDTAKETHEPTLKALLRLARNSHNDRGYKSSPEAVLFQRILRLRRLLELDAPELIVEGEKRLVSQIVAILVGADPNGFTLPAWTQSEPVEPDLPPSERQAALEAMIQDMQEQGLVDEDGYFIDDPN